LKASKELIVEIQVPRVYTAPLIGCSSLTVADTALLRIKSCYLDAQNKEFIEKATNFENDRNESAWYFYRKSKMAYFTER
jgi:hypothetical protein